MSLHSLHLYTRVGQVNDSMLIISEGYVYALLYSYFESFPLVYGPEGYNFPGGVKYLPFAALLVGEAFSFLGYALWAWYVVPLKTPFLLTSSWSSVRTLD